MSSSSSAASQALVGPTKILPKGQSVFRIVHRTDGQSIYQAIPSEMVQPIQGLDRSAVGSSGLKLIYYVDDVVLEQKELNLPSPSLDEGVRTSLLTEVSVLGALQPSQCGLDSREVCKSSPKLLGLVGILSAKTVERPRGSCFSAGGTMTSRSRRPL